MTEFDEFRKACEYFNYSITEGQARVYYYTCHNDTIKTVIDEYRKELSK